MNADADILVLSCMILALNTSGDDGPGQNAFTNDFGDHACTKVFHRHRRLEPLRSLHTC